MIRQIVKIDETLCNGCGDCVPTCHEGAIQIIDGKARLIGESLCDGLGACIGQCPLNAITIENRKAEPYNEKKVMKRIVEKGKNTVITHLKHLKAHNETAYLEEGIAYLEKFVKELDFDIKEVMVEVFAHEKGNQNENKHNVVQEDCHQKKFNGCPGSKARVINMSNDNEHQKISTQSQLRQWPVQLHLISPDAAYFKNANVLIAADCVAFSVGNFHQRWLKGNTIAIACPKLDDRQDIYADKIKRMIDDAKIKILTVMIMQVPCCHGLANLVQKAIQQSKRKEIPARIVIVGIEGNILEEQWIN